MRTIYRNIFLTFVTVLAFSCAKQEIIPSEPESFDVNSVLESLGPVSDSCFYAVAAQSEGETKAETGGYSCDAENLWKMEKISDVLKEETKAYIDPSNSLRILWNGPSFDQVKVYLDGAGSQYNIYKTTANDGTIGATHPVTKLEFAEGDLSRERGTYHAFSPHINGQVEYSNGVFHSVLNVKQKYQQETKTNPRSDMLMVATGDNSRILNFKHATHMVKLTFSPRDTTKTITIVNVRFAAIGGEKLAGNFDIRMDGNSINSTKIVSNGSPYVENTMGGISTTKASRTWYFFIAPGYYSAGFSIIVTYRYNGETYCYSVSSPKATSTTATSAIYAPKGYCTTATVKVPVMTDGQGYLPDVNYADLSAYGLANCYVVNNSAVGCSGNYYKFKVETRGNGVKPEYASSIVTTLNGPYSAATYYTDGDAFIDTSYGKNGFSYNNGYVYFKTKSSSAAGSVLVNVKNSSGTTLWSWNIWSAPALANVEVSGVGTFLNMNIGARQVGFNTDGGNGYYYQWGRKDPMPQTPGSNWGDISSSSNYPPFLGGQSQSLGATIKNPHKFRSGGFVYNDLGASYGLDLWNLDKSQSTVTKTMFDPCPVGYCVPSYNQWTNSALAGKLNLPMASARKSGVSTHIIESGNWNAKGYYWLAYCVSNSGSTLKAIRGRVTNNGGTLVIDSSTGNDGIWGCNVRCVKESSVPAVPGYAFTNATISLDEGKVAQLVLTENGSNYDFVTNKSGINLVSNNLETFKVTDLGLVEARTQGTATVDALGPNGNVLATATVTVSGSSASFNYKLPVAANMIYSNKDICYGTQTKQTAAQGFRIASDGGYFIEGICDNAKDPTLYVQKMTPNAGTSSSHMAFPYAGHGSSFEVEYSGGNHYIWLASMATKMSDGSYMNEQVITRSKYVNGGSQLPEACDDIYWFGNKSGSIQLAIDFENDLIAIGSGGPSTFYVYRLSDVRAVTSTVKKTFEVTRGSETKSITANVHDCSKLTAVASKIEFQPWRTGYDDNHAFQGQCIYKDRIYLIYGDGASAKKDATITAIDFNGDVVSGPNRLALDKDNAALAALNLGNASGYFEPENVQIRNESGKLKMYVGFIWLNNSVWEHATLNINP